MLLPSSLNLRIADADKFVDRMLESLMTVGSPYMALSRMFGIEQAQFYLGETVRQTLMALAEATVLDDQPPDIVSWVNSTLSAGIERSNARYMELERRARDSMDEIDHLHGDDGG